VLEVCASSPQIPIYANEAQERLLNRPGDPVGSWMRYAVCAGSSDCLVWPRQIRHIKSFWVCRQPGIVRPEWFEAIGWGEGGQGKLDSESYAGYQLIDRGTTCCFENVFSSTAEPRKIQAVASDPSDNGKTIHLRYIDEFSQRRYSPVPLLLPATVGEGETLTLSTTGVLTTRNVATNGLYHVVKANTNYPVRLYSYDVNSAAQVALLAIYEPSETHPIYRSTFLPGFTRMPDCHNSTGDPCEDKKVIEILAKLQHVPVVNDNDPFVIGNIAALKLMCKGILMEERHEIDAAEYYFKSAERELDGEIASYLGDGMVMSMKVSDAGTWGAGNVMNPV